MSNTVINPYNFVVGNVGAWKELGRTTLGAEADLISVTGLPNKRYYMLQYVLLKVSAANTRWTFNATTGSEYSSRITTNGSADSTNVSGVNFHTHNRTNGFNYGVSYISNLSANEKLCMFSETGELGGAGSPPDTSETVAKWANTSNSISSIELKNTDTGGFSSGSELVVLGFDPTDTHTEADNFWQELASVELGSAGDTIDSGTITAKKYLWIQGYCSNTGGDIRPTFQFNSDTGSNYANRGSSNGASDTTNTSVDRMYLSDSANQGVPIFFNIFVVNNSANEKLCIAHIIDQGTAGAGNSPNRYESVGKWDNTSSQITSIQVQNDRAGDFNTGSILKVWGSD